MTRTERPGAHPTRLAVLVLGAFVVGMATRGLISAVPDGPTVDRASGRAPAATASGPRRYVDGVPSGFARTGEGARTAAVYFTFAGRTLLELAPTRVPDAIRAMAAGGSADTQVADAQDRIGKLRERLDEGTGPIRYLQAVLASRVDAFTPDRARVSVWSVGVLSRIGIAQPQAGWTTSTYELVWERDDWRVWDTTITAGPAPGLNESALPSTAEQLDEALVGFDPWAGGR